MMDWMTGAAMCRRLAFGGCRVNVAGPVVVRSEWESSVLAAFRDDFFIEGSK